MCKPVKYVTKVKVTASVLLYWVLIRSEDKEKKKKKKILQLLVLLLHTQQCGLWDPKNKKNTPLKSFVWFMEDILMYYRPTDKYMF